MWPDVCMHGYTIPGRHAPDPALAREPYAVKLDLKAIQSLEQVNCWPSFGSQDSGQLWIYTANVYVKHFKTCLLIIVFSIFESPLA